MMQYVRGARSRYDYAMKASKAAKAKAADDAKKASKRKISAEIKHLEAKKANLAKDAANAMLGLDQEIKELKKTELGHLWAFLIGSTVLLSVVQQ